MGRLIIVKSCRAYAVRLENIIYMEKALRKIVLHTDVADGNGYKDIEFYGQFRDVIPSLDRRFMHCHRSYIINMDKIVWMAQNTIYLETNTGIYMGRETYRKAYREFHEYLEQKTASKRAADEMSEKRDEKRR